MPMMNIPMGNMPIMNMPMMEEDEDLKKMYPKMYIRIYPMVRAHCDMMESMYGTMYCPSKEHMDHICKDVCDKYEKHRESEDDDCNDDNDMRQRRQLGRRGPINDLIRILFIRDLLGRKTKKKKKKTPLWILGKTKVYPIHNSIGLFLFYLFIHLNFYF